MDHKEFTRPDILQLLADCRIELKQMHNHIGISDKGKLDYVACAGGCPTLTYADQCSTAVINLREVIMRLQAWRDNAVLMLKNAKPEDEEKWRNQRNNYSKLLALLGIE